MTDEITARGLNVVADAGASNGLPPHYYTRFQKGASGNPGGRPRGAHNKSTLLSRSLLEQATGAVTDKAVQVALQGHPLAIRLCLERIFPRPRDGTIDVALPAIATAEDCSRAFDAILSAVASGAITPVHGEKLTNMVDKRLQSFKFVEFEQRLAAIEQSIAAKSRAREGLS